MMIGNIAHLVGRMAGTIKKITSTIVNGKPVYRKMHIPFVVIHHMKLRVKPQIEMISNGKTIKIYIDGKLYGKTTEISTKALKNQCKSREKDILPIKVINTVIPNIKFLQIGYIVTENSITSDNFSEVSEI